MHVSTPLVGNNCPSCCEKDDADVNWKSIFVKTETRSHQMFQHSSWGACDLIFTFFFWHICIYCTYIHMYIYAVCCKPWLLGFWIPHFQCCLPSIKERVETKWRGNSSHYSPSSEHSCGSGCTKWTNPSGRCNFRGLMCRLSAFRVWS